MEIMLKLLTVLGLGAIELWTAIPVGLALKLNPVVVGTTAAIGAVLGAIIVVLLGERVRVWLVRRHSGKDKKERHRLIHRIWRRYGVIGLGLLAPLLTGAPLGVALGFILGAPAGRLLFWTSIGIVFWSVGLTLAGVLGLEGIKTLIH
ncbi:MAG: small multi-drug export protein [Actinobacteria bacterium]|nr:small multi-drug export protein [Actinomycetota bacterium]